MNLFLLVTRLVFYVVLGVAIFPSVMLLAWRWLVLENKRVSSFKDTNFFCFLFYKVINKIMPISLMAIYKARYIL